MFSFYICSLLTTRIEKKKIHQEKTTQKKKFSQTAFRDHDFQVKRKDAEQKTVDASKERRREKTSSTKRQVT